MNIKIYPAFDALYYSYYLAGLKAMVPDAHYTYPVDSFPAFHHHCLAIELEGCRLYISAGDGPGLNMDALTWAHVYGKVNLLEGVSPDHDPSLLIPIGPSFGVQIMGLATAMLRSLLALASAYRRIANKREHIANYYRQWRYRQPLYEYSYQPDAVSAGFVFFAGSLWKKEAKNNQLRANFIRAVQKIPSLQFEGGFAPRSEMPEYSRLMMEEKYPYSEYIRLLRASQVAYNTPAVQDCLGWKLGEFMALGKAIISTPLTRKMPAPVVHGEHVHFVTGTPEAIRGAILDITGDKEYRLKLEQGARQYWENHLSPSSVINRLLDAVGIRF